MPVRLVITTYAKPGQGAELAQAIVGERCVRQRAGPGDLYHDDVVGRQVQQLWRVGERLRGGWRLERLLQPEVVDHQRERISTQRGQCAEVCAERPMARIVLEASTERAWVARCVEA